MNKAQAIKRYRASIKLRRLYHAYMSSDYSTSILARRIEAQVAEDDGLTSAEKTERMQDLSNLRSVSKERFLVFAERGRQLSTRIDELAEWTE